MVTALLCRGCHTTGHGVLKIIFHEKGAEDSLHSLWLSVCKDYCIDMDISILVVDSSVLLQYSRALYSMQRCYFRGSHFYLCCGTVIRTELEMRRER
jgi:hypothetical protein